MKSLTTNRGSGEASLHRPAKPDAPVRSSERGVHMKKKRKKAVRRKNRMKANKHKHEKALPYDRNGRVHHGTVKHTTLHIYICMMNKPVNCAEPWITMQCYKHIRGLDTQDDQRNKCTNVLGAQNANKKDVEVKIARTVIFST